MGQTMVEDLKMHRLAADRAKRSESETERSDI